MLRASMVLALSLVAVAPAMADTISVLKANTLVLHQQDGKAHTILVKDATELEQVNAAGVWARGFWAMEERGFCWTARGAAKLCIAMPADKDVGDTWEIRGPTGKLVWAAEIQAGRADLKALAEAIDAASAIDETAEGVDAVASDAKE